jgi:hypothetical protein
VGAVAFYTGGIFFADFIFGIGMVASEVLFIDSLVAVPAGGLHIGRVDRRAFILFFQHVVGGVAVCTYGADCQSFSGKPLSVYALGVVCQCIHLFEFGGLRSFAILPVTITTQFGNGCTVYGRGIVIPRLGGMCTMAVGAIRGVFYLIVMGLAMATLKIEVKQFCMTGGAVHGSIGGTGALKVLGYLGVAFHTGDVLVD